MTKFWVYVFFASCALILAFASSNQYGSRDWVIGIWGLIGCFPWWLVLAFVAPNADFTLTNISVFSVLNAVLIYWLCKAQQRQGAVLMNMAFLLGRLFARVRK